MSLSITMRFRVNRSICFNFIDSIILSTISSILFIFSIIVILDTKIWEEIICIWIYLRFNHIVHETGTKTVTINNYSFSFELII
nr:MAG TPA: hypothetical protein [Caudoviricetes sp.]